MFDFEKLEVYQVTKIQNLDFMKWLIQNKEMDKDIADQWKASSMGTVLNLAESTARMTHPEKKHYLTIARGNINTCVALLEVAKEFSWIDAATAEQFYAKYEQMSKMMLGMIRSFTDKLI
jgi:four helix bundle protein